MFDVLDELDDAIDKVAGSDAPVDVARLRRLVDRAELLWLRAVRDSERAGEWQAGGAVSPAAWLRDRCGLTHGTASAALRQGRMLETMPEVAGAFAEGEISRQHVAMIEQACTPERRTAIEALDVQVADVARNADPQRLRQVMRRIGDALDGDGGAANDEQQHGRRRAHLSRTLDRMGVLDALLDPEGTEIVLSASRTRISVRDGATHPSSARSSTSSCWRGAPDPASPTPCGPRPRTAASRSRPCAVSPPTPASRASSPRAARHRSTWDARRGS